MTDSISLKANIC